MKNGTRVCVENHAHISIYETTTFCLRATENTRKIQNQYFIDPKWIKKNKIKKEVKIDSAIWSPQLSGEFVMYIRRIINI